LTNSLNFCNLKSSLLIKIYKSPMVRDEGKKVQCRTNIAEHIQIICCFRSIIFATVKSHTSRCWNIIDFNRSKTVMNELIAKSEPVKKAIKWISDKNLQERREISSQLIQEAIFRFDLSPADAEFLFHFYHSGKR
jgi:hypothetical protein